MTVPETAATTPPAALRALEVDAAALGLMDGRWTQTASGLGFAADHSQAHKGW